MKRFHEEYKGLSMQRTIDPEFFELLKRPAVPHLKEKKVGKFEIKIELIEPAKPMTVVSARNWLLMGYKQLKVQFDGYRPVYKLYEDGRLRMSDTPQEMFLQYDAYKEAHGKVLMGGLGLGMSATLFAEKEEVDEVVVIEKSEDVIKLCKPKNKKIRVIKDDIWNYLKTTEEGFDFIYVDIHYSTGCMEYIHTVIPMKKILNEKFPGIKSMFWGEEEMESQYDPDFEKHINKTKEVSYDKEEPHHAEKDAN